MEHAPTGGWAWLGALEHSGLGQTLRSSLWLYPAVETLHILGLAMLVGAIVTYDARVAAAGRGLDLPAWSRAVLPVARLGFLLAVPMGLLLFTTEARAFAANPVFRLKLVLILLALGNVAFFHAQARGKATPTAALRASAILSIALWTLVLASGRLIAYV